MEGEEETLAAIFFCVLGFFFSLKMRGNKKKKGTAKAVYTT